MTHTEDTWEDKLYLRTKARLTRLIYLRAKTKGKEWDVRDIVMEIVKIYAVILLSQKAVWQRAEADKWKEKLQEANDYIRDIKERQ